MFGSYLFVIFGSYIFINNIISFIGVWITDLLLALKLSLTLVRVVSLKICYYLLLIYEFSFYDTGPMYFPRFFHS